MNRHRSWSWQGCLVILALVLAACGAPAPATETGSQATTAPAAAEPTEAVPTEVAPAEAAPTEAAATGGEAVAGILNGVTLPADAAPPEQQVYVVHYDNTSDFTTIDFYESVYKRGGAIADVLSDSLVRLDKNFEIQPGAATEWSVDDSGLVWTFKLDPALMWNDDTPVTADDYVATLRYGADPEHAWDFSWYFQGVIKNWAQAVEGSVPVDQIGVRAVDANTLEITTETPAPYLPSMMLYSNAMQKKALETHGGLYNSDVATSVSSGPYVLKEWRKGERLVYEANPKYMGTNKPFIQKVIVIGAAPSTNFAAYQANEIDSVGGASLSPADNEIIQADPELKNQFHPHYGDFRTHYLFFDTQNPPFNDVKVRQAISRVVDRDGIIQSIVKPTQGMAAYSFLMPGFPAANAEALKPLQSYDVEQAKQLLADAGFPNGEGFPKLTLWLRNEGAVRQAAAQAIAASIKQNLGIDVEVSNKEYKTFMDALNAKPTQIQFGLVSYGMDFLDPANMLGVWQSGGRHNWNNAEFDALYKEASSFTGDAAERIKMFQDAERMLVEQVGGVFLYHETPGDLYRPYLKGSELEPDKQGVAAMHWPGFSTYSELIGSMYIGNEVTNYRSAPPQ
jgi:ABC-type oligopeptide transport system substrate-binding subunit